MDNRKRILVFGSTGFIGSEFTRILMKNQDRYDIYLIMHRRFLYKEYEGIKIISGSLPDFDLSWLKKINPDYIVHMARMRGRGEIGRAFAAWRGAKANKRIIDYLIKTDIRPRIIYISGSLVYGSHGEKMVREDEIINPASYAKQYINAEKPWMECLENKSLPVSILRPPWIVGKDSWFKYFFLNQIEKHSMVPLIGEGNNWMSVISLEDCANLIFHFLKEGIDNIYFNVCMPGKYIKLKDFVSNISEIASAPVQNFPTKKAKNIFGETATKAFETSLKLHTQYPEIYSGYTFRDTDIEMIVSRNLKDITIANHKS